MRLVLHETRAQQLLFWRSREAAIFTFFLPVVLFLIFGAVYGDSLVDDEIAILRIVMARLVAEEDDPVTLAKAISRVAAVSIQAAKARRAISGQLAESLTDAITAILADLDGG